MMISESDRCRKCQIKPLPGDSVGCSDCKHYWNWQDKSNKVINMNEKIMRKYGLDNEMDKVHQGKCPLCNKNIGTFKDKLSEKEFKISGMCQACQDDFFNEESPKEMVSELKECQECNLRPGDSIECRDCGHYFKRSQMFKDQSEVSE